MREDFPYGNVMSGAAARTGDFIKNHVKSVLIKSIEVFAKQRI